TKTFGEFVAVDNLNLTIDKGEIFGLLGPNGAGKSTTIKMLIGLLKPTYGEIFVLGENDVNKYKQYTGYLPETPNLYEYLTIEEFLTFIGTLKKVKKDLLDERIKEYSEIFDLKDKLKSYIGSLSHGMKQKVAIMATLINDPKVLLLDEPLNGLDPMSQKDFKDIIREKADEGCSILLSTHILDVAERICTTVGVFNKGNLITTGTLAELRAMYRSPPTSTLEDIFLKITKEPAQ
ncbi:MAG TPA: ABC transporter ATP-binding protein, partial [Halobacteria archaeon]|nr:ABC transporter ATP-binding protein [Halobacteria archaeon]